MLSTLHIVTQTRSDFDILKVLPAGVQNLRPNRAVLAIFLVVVRTGVG